MRYHHKPRDHKSYAHKPRVSPRKEKLVEIDESDNLDQVLGSAQVGQELLGLTDGQLRGMYDTANMLLDVQQVESAIRGLSLLCQLHPYIADFWLGLGQARRLSGQPELAISAFLVAETMDCHRADIVAAVVECFLELQDIKGAARVLKRAAKHLRDPSISTDDKRSLEHEITRLENLIDHQARVA